MLRFNLDGWLIANPHPPDPHHAAPSAASAAPSRAAPIKAAAAPNHLPGIRLAPSPNHDERPAATPVHLLVIHNISLPPGQFGGPYIEDLFLNQIDYSAHPWFEQLRSLRVSAHFLIRRCGAIVQFVSINKRAWHAGVSQFNGQPRCNDFSVGIELEGTDTQPYTEQQYKALGLLTVAIRSVCPLHAVRGHEHIAPGRKTDPGPAFDWQRYGREAHWQTDQLPPAAGTVPTA